MSGVYHLLRPGSGGRTVLQRLDHSGIFVRIAGTFTPVHAILFRSLQKRDPVRLSWGNGIVHLVMNRREFTPRGVILGVNARGPADRSVPVLRIDGADGKPRAVLFGAATHNTTLTGNCYEVCGDYAGFAQSYVQEKNPGVQAMFILGCAGDSDPYPRGTMDIAREHGVTLGKEACRVLQSKRQPIRGRLNWAFGKADLPLQAPPSRPELEKQAAAKNSVQAWIAKQMLNRLNCEKDCRLTMRRRFAFGNSARI
jgi:neutral ceramidase